MHVPTLPARVGVRPGPGRLLGAAGSAATLVLACLTLAWEVDTGVADGLVLLVSLVPAGLLGSVVVAARPRDPVGWAFLTTALLFLVGTASLQWALQPLPGIEVAVWLQFWTYQVGLVPLFVLAPLYFPDGRLPSPRWRPAARAALVAMAALGLVLALTPTSVPFGTGRADNPLGVLPPAAEWVGTALSVVLLGLVLAAAVSLVVRFGTAGAEDRARIKLMTAAVVFVALVFVLDAVVHVAWPDAYGDVFPLVQLSPVTVVAAAAVSILRHRLFDVEKVLDRALLYALLTGAVVALYAVVVALLRPVGPDAPVVSLVTAGVVAVAVLPLRSRLQRVVDRLVYGDRADPYRALSLLGRRLEAALSPAAALPAVVEAVSDALHLPYVAIESRTADGGHETRAAHGTVPEQDAALTHVPLVHAGEQVGRLTLGPRGRRLDLSAGDGRVLEDLARQVGVALHAVQAAERASLLSADLQRSRERLVLAREEERRRIGRDLHDGLGPQLAGLSMTAEAARDLIGVDDDRAGRLLDGLLDRADTAVQEVRRLAHQLRPPALDALGLVEALRSQAAVMTRPVVDVDAPPLPPLPAAVEVAAYRIALEALRNVAAHADAARCRVGLRLADGVLVVTVADDGRGVTAAPRTGLGTTSMRERAAELGGSCTVAPAPGGGTCVHAVLPCAPADPGQR